MSERPHKKLDVWQVGIEFVTDLYSATETFPKEEKFGLISQIRKASVSVPTNIAEGAARGSNQEFLRFLHISSGSLSELDTLLIISRDLDFLSQDLFSTLMETLKRMEIMLNGLIQKLKE